MITMGKILLEENNLLTEVIPEDMLNRSIVNFCEMHTVATHSQDEFYALASLYSNLDAPICRYFKPWDDFIKQEYGKRISMNLW